MNVGDLVIAFYKSGEYVGELVQLGTPKSKVRVLAVRKHPKQGDLHHPNRADVGYFDQRRALAYREVANVFTSQLKPYPEAEAPDYQASLKEALLREMEDMRQLNNDYGRRSLEELTKLAADYQIELD